jgi:hypothetical protein
MALILTPNSSASSRLICFVGAAITSALAKGNKLRVKTVAITVINLMIDISNSEFLFHLLNSVRVKK